MAVLTLPKQSRVMVAICLIGQAIALYAVANHSYRNLLACVIAFFVGGYITDTSVECSTSALTTFGPHASPSWGPLPSIFAATT
jgi:hypothetical protein